MHMNKKKEISANLLLFLKFFMFMGILMPHVHARKKDLPPNLSGSAPEAMMDLKDSAVESIGDDHPTSPNDQLGQSTEPIIEHVEEKTPKEALDAVHPKTTPIKGRLITLRQAMEGAYGQSPLVTAEYDVKAAQMALSTAKRDWLPRTSASLSYTGNTGYSETQRALTTTGGRTDSSGNTKSGTTEGAFIVQQNLYSGGATTASILGKSKLLEAKIASYATRARDTLLSAIKAFLELSVKQEIYRLNKNSQKVLERQLEVAKNRYEFGELTRYDVAATQAKLDKAKADVITALSETETSKATFLKVCGLDVNGPLEKPGYPEKLIPKSKSEAIQIALKMSPTLKVQDALAEAAEAEADQTFGGLLPSFDLSATASSRLSDQYDKRSFYEGHGTIKRSELEAKATLSIPLDFRGSTQSSIREKKYLSAQKKMEAIYERRNIMENVSKQWDSLEAAKAKIKQLESQVAASQIALETVNEEFLSGSKTTLDVLNAEQQLSNAQVELVQAEQSVILSAYSLIAALGRLNAPNLELNVALYNPHLDAASHPFWGVNIQEDRRLDTQEFSNQMMKDAEATNEF